jgi:hypothetical protein
VILTRGKEWYLIVVDEQIMQIGAAVNYDSPVNRDSNLDRFVKQDRFVN